MRKDYKEILTLDSMQKRGQVAIFVIIAILIVAVILFLFVYPNVEIISSDINPSAYLTDCIKPEVDSVLGTLAKQGGYLEPLHYTVYQDTKIQYLCYTTENYKPCVIQQPMIKSHVEEELQRKIEPIARNCMNDLKDVYQRKGYQVNAASGAINVSFIPGKLVIDFLAPLTLTKETTQTFQKFALGIDSQMYDLLLTATSILQFESTLGDSETNLYIQYYPDLKIEKMRRDSDTIYKLTNVVSNESFTFATRSLVWPAGFGLAGGTG